MSTQPDGDSIITGWGRRPSGLRAIKRANQKGIPFLLLEDGFLRSVGREDEALSVVYDDLGIYYDASAPSRLERLISRPLTAHEIQRSTNIIKGWQRDHLSKYNYARDYEAPLPTRYVLVIDQIRNDTSIGYGLANEASFKTMLQAALDENPDCDVIIKTHPDCYSRGRQGYYSKSGLPFNLRLHFIDEECHPVRLLQEAQKIYTVTSQIGFEALIWGKKVRCFGMPFYAGWGLTDDMLEAPERRQTTTLEQLVHAALVEYPRYINPISSENCAPETVMAHIALQRHMRTRFSKQVYAYGFTRWKRPVLRNFLQGSHVTFIKKPHNLPQDGDVFVWGCIKQQNPIGKNRVFSVEDGFLRSVGLGVDLVRPLSWVFDDIGIYYNTSCPSKLEHILSQTVFSSEQLMRAEKLRQALVATGITKYNLSAPKWQRPPTDKKIILVPGQVENDASIRFGSLDIKTNLDLLKAVRKAEPEALIVYKPHPDVVAGLRKGGDDEEQAAGYFDEIITNANTAQLLHDVDEVHCLTSLLGFEALLRQKPVKCYGRPFYAGWGLTTDIPARIHAKRALQLNELVAGCLMLYPAYFSHQHGFFVSVDNALDELIELRKQGRSGPTLGRKILRIVLRLYKKRK